MVVLKDVIPMIKKPPFFMHGILLFVLFLTACSLSLPSQQTTPRTYYESLELSTPESAVKTFTSAFQRSDFLTVYWVFSPEAQDQLTLRMNLLDYQHLLKLDPSLDPLEATRSILAGTPWGDSSAMEHRGDVSYYFDVLMMAAKEHSALLIDLSGTVSIQDTIASPSQESTDVVTSIDGIAGNVVFRTVQSPSGRWRVLQVIVPGGDEDQIPWSMPKRSEP